MSTIQEQVAVIRTELEKPMKDVNKSQVRAKLMQLHADLQDDNTEIPLAMFEEMGNMGRQTALLGLTVMWITTLQME